MSKKISNIYIANVEKELPFDGASFDLVILGEVLEHLRDDYNALNNIKKVLKDDGYLIVSLPFYNDWEEGHMRIHSKISGERLLNISGFRVIDYLERPGIYWSNMFNFFNHTLNFLIYLLTKKVIYKQTNKFITFIEWKLGHWQSLCFIRKFSKHFGGYYLCEKDREGLDYLEINKNLYTKN